MSLEGEFRDVCAMIAHTLRGIEKGNLLMNIRKDTVFRRLAIFTADLDAFDPSVIVIIENHILQFQRAWRASRHDGELSPGFHFEAYVKIDDPYRLCQIRVGPKQGYRASVMFLDGSSGAYWVYIFKKMKDKQPDDMKRARHLAQRFWNELERKNENGTR